MPTAPRLLHGIYCVVLSMHMHYLSALQNTSATAEVSLCIELFDEQSHQKAVWCEEGADALIAPALLDKNATITKLINNYPAAPHNPAPSEYARLTQAHVGMQKRPHSAEQSPCISTCTHTITILPGRIKCLCLKSCHTPNYMYHSIDVPDKYIVYAATDIGGFPLLVFSRPALNYARYLYFGPQKKSGDIPIYNPSDAVIKQLIFSKQDTNASTATLALLIALHPLQWQLKIVNITLQSKKIVFKPHASSRSIIMHPDDSADKVMDCSVGFNPQGTIGALAVRMTYAQPSNAPTPYDCAYRIRCFDTHTGAIDSPEVTATTHHQDGIAPISIPYPNAQGSMIILGNMLIYRNISDPDMPIEQAHAAHDSAQEKQTLAHSSSSYSSPQEYEQEYSDYAPYPDENGGLTDMFLPMQMEHQYYTSDGEQSLKEEDFDRWFEELSQT